MQSMKEISDAGFDAIPAGRYPAIITAATQWTSKMNDDGSGGRPGIKLTLEVREGDHAGRKLFDQFLTDPNFYGKKKLLGLGVDANGDDRDDAELCDELLGREVFVNVLTETAKTYEDGKLVTKKTIDAEGRVVVQKQNKIEAYSLMNVGGNGPTEQAHAPVQQQAVQQPVQQQAAPTQQVAAPKTGNKAPPPWNQAAGATSTGPQGAVKPGGNKVLPKPQASK